MMHAPRHARVVALFYWWQQLCASSFQHVTATTAASRSQHRADWLHDCGWGVFTHYLPGNRDADPVTNASTWNRIVDSFNTAHLAEQLEEVGACYYYITLGQGSGWYLGPNPTYDAFAQHDPPHTSRRDLIADLHAALAPRGIRLGVYLPYEPPWEDANVSARMGYREEGAMTQVSQDLLGGRFPLGRTLRNGSRGPWVPEQYGLDDSVGEVFGHGRPYGFGTDRLVQFQTHWNAMIAGWSRRYGSKVSGWWFDGCYHSLSLHDFADDDPPNFRTFAEAARVGNPAAALAFNPGQVPWLPSLSSHQDYTAGEIGVKEQFPSPNGRRFSNLNAQYHILSYLGPLWGCFLKQGGHNVSCRPRFTDAELATVVRAYTKSGWAITLDVPIHDNGTLYPPFLTQLKALRRFSRRAHVVRAPTN